MPDSSITYEPIPEGYRIYKGPFLLGIFSCNHDAGWEQVKEGQRIKIWQPLARESWQIHFTHPVQTVVQLQAIMESLPEG